MGRKTFESIGRPLPGRKNIILTKDLNYKVPDCITVSSFNEAINIATTEGQEELMVIGGAQVYGEALLSASRIYLTEVDYDGDADAFFPEINLNDWKVTSTQKNDDIIPWTFKVLEK